MPSLAPKLDTAVKFPNKPTPTLRGEVLPIPERESTEAGDIFGYHGPGLTQGHSSMTADMFDAGALHRGLGALGGGESRNTCGALPLVAPQPAFFRGPSSHSIPTVSLS